MIGERYELLIGLRYTRAKRRNHFISFISLASMLGIGLGVATLIVVLSVMNGFESELRGRILGMASHATISGNEDGLPDWQAAAAFARQNPAVIGTAPYIEGEALVKVGGEISGTVIRGVVPAEEAQVSEIGTKMDSGRLDDLAAGEFRIVLGHELASSSAWRVGDKVDLMIPQLSVTPAGVLPRFRRFTVAGVFRVGMYEFDRGLVLIHMADAAALYRMGRPGDRRAAEARRPVRRAPGRPRDCPGDTGGLLRVGLDAQPRQLLPRGGDRKDRDVPDPFALGRHRRLQHRLDAGHGRAGQAGRHCHPAHAGRDAAFGDGDNSWSRAR